MNEATQTKSGPAVESDFLPVPGAPDIMMLWYAVGARAILEAMRAALELNRSLNDIGREVVRRAQDEAIAALLRGLASNAAPRPPPEAGFADLTRMGMETVMQSMTAAMRTFGSSAHGTEAPEASAKPTPSRSRTAA
ncbi:hypothetical protein [Siccirubricoccus sp. G192]|uniref:hypothetical protein n=1 Tax=Siccirubricoccus sp. G192 TaxID=2849651 RepID=UPI001C2BAE1D|nr:hypothetical protein [Siccirubricoccus sp. G192]MBV1798897.1 hypothetical protein [Siccirubricoccus sp. G192]